MLLAGLPSPSCRLCLPPTPPFQGMTSSVINIQQTRAEGLHTSSYSVTLLANFRRLQRAGLPSDGPWEILLVKSTELFLTGILDAPESGCSRKPQRYIKPMSQQAGSGSLTPRHCAAPEAVAKRGRRLKSRPKPRSCRWVPKDTKV